MVILGGLSGASLDSRLRGTHEKPLLACSRLGEKLCVKPLPLFGVPHVQVNLTIEMLPIVLLRHCCVLCGVKGRKCHRPSVSAHLTLRRNFPALFPPVTSPVFKLRAGAGAASRLLQSRGPWCPRSSTMSPDSFFLAYLLACLQSN